MKGCVVDTSALMRLYVPDGPIPKELEGHLQGASRGDEVMFTPELALVEAAQVLHKKTAAGHLHLDEAEWILRAILDLPLVIFGHRDALEQSALIARRRRLTVYDAIFIAGALARTVPLITADRRLAAAFAKEHAPR